VVVENFSNRNVFSTPIWKYIGIIIIIIEGGIGMDIFGE
jgi:hypothetical protein